jgi:ABC-type transport system involved in multi-copper enzyme maturation permease subunit
MFLPGVPGRFRSLVAWLYVFGEPMANTYGTTWWQALQSGLILWVKVLSLFCLLGWVVSWLATALKERTVARGSWLDFAALGAVVLGVVTMLLRVLESTQRIPIYKIAGVYTVTLLTALCVAVFFLWIETALWSAIAKSGRRADYLVLVGIHLALLLGLAVAFEIRSAANTIAANSTIPPMTWNEALVVGARIGATYMGYVVLLRVALVVLGELFAIRARRLYSIAKLSVVESNRRMWAPWVVITVFLVVLAFTHWFLQPPRAAEVGRLYVGTLTLLCSLLLTVMVTLLTPLSLPQDIQSQTIYTVVSKPVRRIELIWGRMLGFMAIVTVLMAVFGVISLGYLSRTVGGTITATEQLAIKAAKQNKMTEARQLREQAEQIRTRMAARVPVYGSLTFLDSKGTPHLQGIDVGMEQSMREPRSHIEGATPATAIWSYGLILDPFVRQGGRARYLDCRIPADLLLTRDTVEGLLDQTYTLKARIAQAEQQQAAGGLTAAKVKELSDTITRAREELKQATDAYDSKKARADELDAQAAAAERAGKADAQSLRRQAAAQHSPRVPMEMTFNVYRTTKGRVGEPVYAEIEVTNPNLPPIPDVNPYRNIFPIREYYTNRLEIPSALFAGTRAVPAGREQLRIEVRCISPTQYLGMAQSDLFLLVQKGKFGWNFMKGLFGVWLQALVLTAIGVFAGTFLSWPVALLTTIAFFVAGQVAFSFLLEFSQQSLIGGGPFESLIRLLSHDNQMSELTPTLAVVTAKTLDALVMPVMSRLVFIVPNFSALDVTNTVADGFDVSWALIGVNTLLALAYALPFSIAAYFILKNREVAA